MVLIAPPPPSKPPRPLFHTLKPGTFLVRLYNPNRHAQNGASFRNYGPLLRFDHLAPNAAGPANDPFRAIYYAGSTLSGCLVEIFGDTREIDCGDWHIARPQIVRPVKLLNLRGYRAMRAGSVTAIAKVPDHSLSQQWSRYFYEQPQYENCDGILYENAHNGEGAIALYERARDAVICPPTSVIRLDHPAMRPEVLAIARRNHLVCVS